MYNPEFSDPYGQDIYETEEERRRRLAAEAEANMPVKQTITYDPKTGAQKVKIEGGASNLTSANPATPTVAGPVDPNDIYQRMIQAESGGRQFDAQGGVLTSPKGAMGAGQVMPATAMQPGYGVTNIFDLAQQRGVPVPSRDQAGAQQLLGNEQLNREFGQSYFNAMQQRFPGQPEASVAAYNAGPGRVGQNMQANAGQLNTSQLPNETQAYIQSVLNRQPQQAQAQQPQPIINDQGQMVGQETPAQMVAGAQTNAPIAPVQPGTQPQMMQTQAPAAQPGAIPEQMGPSTQFMSQPGWIERFNTAQGDIGTLSSMLADPNLPKGAQMEIAASMADQMRFQKMEAEKREQYTRAIETGDLRSLQREDRKGGGEGSWLRYIMFGLMGSPSAQIEKQRLMPELFAKPDYITLTDGQTQAVVFKDDNGNILRGTTADGRSLTRKELIENARTGLGKDATFTAAVYVDKNTGERYRSGTDKSGNAGLVNVQTGRLFRGKQNDLNLESQVNALSRMDAQLITDLKKKHGSNVLNALSEFQSGSGPLSTDQRQQFLQMYGYGQALPGGGAPGAAPTGTQPGVPGAQPRPGQQPLPSTVATGGVDLTQPTGAVKTQTAISEATQKVFAEKRIPEIIEEGDAGGSVARIRREQLDTIRDNPSILGIYQGRGTDYDRARNVITNVISGAYGAEDSGKLRDDLKAISISPAEKAALENFANLNMQLNVKTLKANTGGGQISGAEQKINKETNLSEIASQTPLASMQGLHRSMFVGDLNNARAGFLTANPDLNTDAKFASAWNKEKSQANKAYEGIMRERAEFLKGYVPPRNPTPQQITAFNERVFKAFEMFPAPRWDSEQNKWNYQTKNAELAAARALGR
jgi:hypothetical protein